MFQCEKETFDCFKKTNKKYKNRSEQLGDSLTARIFYPYVVCTVPCFFVQHDASSLFLNLIHVAEFCFMLQR